MPRPFRFSVQAASAESGSAWTDVAERVEAAGYDAMYVPDHLDGPFAPFTALAYAAAVTTSLRLGTLVLNNDLRHPSVVAREVATLDLLSGGRVELGIGAGHASEEYERAGIGFDPAGVRIERLAESLGIVRRLLGGAAVTLTGTHYSVTDDTCRPTPVQQRVPLLVGGGDRRVLALAAERADVVGLTGLGRSLPGGHHEPSGWPAAAVDAQVAHVRESAGDRDPEIQALCQGVVVTDDPDGVASHLAETRLTSLSAADLHETPYLLIGPVDHIADRLRRGRDRWGISHVTVRSDAADGFAPVVAALSGT